MSRPSLLAIVMWPFLMLIGLACVIVGRTGAVIFGVVILALCVMGFGTMLRSRVWVDGDVLHSRTLWKWGPPIRLDRLLRAELTTFGRNSGRQLYLSDRDGGLLQFEVTNTSVRRLWPVLAEYIRWDTEVANDLLRKRVRKHWPGPPLGPG